MRKRVNIGDCSIAKLAMQETAKSPMFAHNVEEGRVLEEDCYVDDILTSHNDQIELDKIIEEIKEILRASGFFLKPWVRSGQRRRQEKGMQSQLEPLSP